MRVCLMVEGQEGVTWEQWVALAQACERSGLEGLFRSDHYTGFHSAHGGALDCWATLSALAAVTDRIHLGSLVSPATFRHPSVLARMVVTADQVAPGRIELGIGAGWNEDEHVRHGFPFPPLAERLERFAEQVEIVHRQWTEDEFDFSGEHYELRGSRALPKPTSKPNMIVGGSAKAGTIEPAVRFADEYNTVFATADECRERKRRLDEACERAGREPLAFSLMTGCIVGSDRDDLDARRGRLAEFLGRPVEEVGTGAAAIVGTVDEVVERLRELERAGVERVMLQQLLHEDVEMVELLGREVAPAVA